VLFSATSKSPQGAGKIVDTSPVPDGSYVALVTTEISAATANDLQLRDADGAALEIGEQPYNVVLE